jgi:hypothetical protein
VSTHCFDVSHCRSQSVRVDQHPAVTLIFQPPVSEVLREPARGAFRRKILNAGAIDDGDTELGLDRVQGAADSIGMYVGGNVERFEAPLDVLKGRLDEDGLPTEPGKPTAYSEKALSVGHGARHYVGEVFTFQREKTLHPFQRVVACFQGDPPLPANPVGVVQEKRKRLFLSRVYQHNRLGNTRATDDVVSVAHYSQSSRARGSETTIPVAHKQTNVWTHRHYRNAMARLANRSRIDIASSASDKSSLSAVHNSTVPLGSWNSSRPLGKLLDSSTGSNLSRAAPSSPARGVTQTLKPG